MDLGKVLKAEDSLLDWTGEVVLCLCLYSVIPVDCQLCCLVAGRVLTTEVTVWKIRSTFICEERACQDCVAEMVHLEEADQGVLCQQRIQALVLT